MKKVLLIAPILFFYSIVYSQLCNNPNPNFCTNNFLNNGDFESITANPNSAFDEDINLATNWYKVWKGISTGDLFCSNGDAVNLTPVPLSGVYAGFWIENRTSLTTDNTYREGIYNKLKTNIIKNSGNYTLKFNIADSKVNTSINPVTIGIYGVYNPTAAVANEPLGFANPKNVDLWASNLNIKVVLLGKITTPTNLSNTWLPQTISINSNDASFPVNGITHIMITAYDDALAANYAKLYINFDEFCLQKDSVVPSQTCCPKVSAKYGVCEPQKNIKHGEFTVDNLGASSPICKVTMSYSPATTFLTSNLNINGASSSLTWNPTNINLTAANNAQKITFTLNTNTSYNGSMTIVVERCDGTKCEYKQSWKGISAPIAALVTKEKDIDLSGGYGLTAHQFEILPPQNIKFTKGFIVIGFGDKDTILQNDKPEFFGISGAVNPFDEGLDYLLPVNRASMGKYNAFFEIENPLKDSDINKLINIILKVKKGTGKTTKLSFTMLDETGQIIGTSETNVKNLSTTVTTATIELNKNNSTDVFELINAFPNPAQNEVNLKYLIGRERDLKLELYNLDGKLLQTIDKGIKSPGLHEINLDISALPSSSYIVKLISQTEISTLKIVVVK